MPIQQEVIFKFCPDCGCNREHVLEPNQEKYGFPKCICSGCMPMAFIRKTTEEKKVAASHTFRRCPKCHKLEEFFREGLAYVCKGCNPERFPTEKKQKETPLKIKRPSKELV